MLLTQLPLLRNKHRASIFKNTEQLCYNIPSPVAGQYSLFQAPPPPQAFLSSALKGLDALKSQFSSLHTSPRSGIFPLRARARVSVCESIWCGVCTEEKKRIPFPRGLPKQKHLSLWLLRERRRAPPMSSWNELSLRLGSGAAGAPGGHAAHQAVTGKRARGHPGSPARPPRRAGISGPPQARPCPGEAAVCGGGGFSSPPRRVNEGC